MPSVYGAGNCCLDGIHSGRKFCGGPIRRDLHGGRLSPGGTYNSNGMSALSTRALCKAAKRGEKRCGGLQRKSPCQIPPLLKTESDVGANGDYLTMMMSLLMSKVLGPIPGTFMISSGFWKGPLTSLYSTILAA